MAEWNTGVPRSEETKKESHRMRSGIEWRLWRDAVFERDQYSCLNCDKRGGELHPHHIYSFADNEKYRFEPDNGVTLCMRCHKEFHKKYGYGGNDVEQLEDWWGKSKDEADESSLQRLDNYKDNWNSLDDLWNNNFGLYGDGSDRVPKIHVDHI